MLSPGQELFHLLSLPPCIIKALIKYFCLFSSGLSKNDEDFKKLFRMTFWCLKRRESTCKPPHFHTSCWLASLCFRVTNRQTASKSWTGLNTSKMAPKMPVLPRQSATVTNHCANKIHHVMIRIIYSLYIYSYFSLVSPLCLLALACVLFHLMFSYTLVLPRNVYIIDNHYQDSFSNVLPYTSIG